MAESLGKAVLDLEANLQPFERNVRSAKRTGDELQHGLDAIAAVARVAEIELNKVKLDTKTGIESEAVAGRIERSVGSVGRAAMEASAHLEKVKLGEEQAVETRVAADQITNDLQKVERQALRTRLAISTDSRRDPVTGQFLPGGGGGGRNGVGVGPFGSGFGRIGLLGAAVGGGTLLGPAAGPGALGLLAALPVLAATGAGALGTLALAFDGVGKAIGGNKKAFDALEPAQQQFVLRVRSLDGALDKLKQTAAAALFPGLTAGLVAALSPGTMAEITHAVTLFGHAIGQAGALWGHYFGSSEFQSIFGPLMAAGARNLGTLSDTALHLADAVGVLARAAIPLVDWMLKGIDAGSRWADSFTHAKDATGGLDSAMSQAKQSLQLVGNLFAALGKAVFSLGAALYPVSKIAVKDLTDGLNALAGIIDRNKQTIRDIVTGALAALVTAIKIAVPIVGFLAKGLDAVAHAVGGWKDAFEIVLTGVLAVKLVAVADAVVGIGAAASASMPYVTALAAALYGAYKFGQWLAGHDPKSGYISPTDAAEMKAHPGAYFNSAGQHVTKSGKLLLPFADQRGQAPPAGTFSQPGLITRRIPSIFTGKSTSGESSTLIAALQGLSRYEGGANIDVISGYRNHAKQQALWDASVKAGHTGFMPNGNPIAPPGTSPHESGSALDGTINIGGRSVPLSSLPASVLTRFGLTTVAGDVNHVQLSSLAATGYVPTASPFDTSTIPAWTSGLGPKPPKPPKPPVISAAITHLLNLASRNATNSSTIGNTGGTAKRYLTDELVELSRADLLLTNALASAKGKAKTQLDTALTNVENKMEKVGQLIHDALVKTGAALLPERLKAKMSALSAKFTADTAYSSLLSGQPLIDMQGVIQENLSNQADALTRETAALKAQLVGASVKQKAAIDAEIKTIAAKIKSVQTETLNSLESAVQALQGKVGTAFQAVTSQLDAAFQAKTQQLLDALGVKYFQNGALTDSEQKLADLQRQETQDQLQQALADAQKAVADAQSGAMVYDSSTGLTTVKADNPALVAAQKQLLAAQRAIDADALQTKATKERTAADQAYAVESKKLQEDRSASEAEMNVKLAALGDAFQNGTGTLGELTAIAQEYGIVIGDMTIPGAAVLTSAFGDLSAAASDLYAALSSLIAAIAAVTGATPDLPPSATPVAPGGGYTQAEVDQINASYIAAGIPGRVTLAGASTYFQSHIGPYGGKPLPMAAGGMGRVTMPTLFLAGEAGAEDFAFSGGGKSFGGLSTSTGGAPIVVHVSGVVGNEAEVAMRIGKELQKLNLRGVKFSLA